MANEKEQEEKGNVEVVYFDNATILKRAFCLSKSGNRSSLHHLLEPHDFSNSLSIDPRSRTLYPRSSLLSYSSVSCYSLNRAFPWSQCRLTLGAGTLLNPEEREVVRSFDPTDRGLDAIGFFVAKFQKTSVS